MIWIFLSVSYVVSILQSFFKKIWKKGLRTINYVRHLSCGFTEETFLLVFPVRTLHVCVKTKTTRVSDFRWKRWIIRMNYEFGSNAIFGWRTRGKKIRFLKRFGASTQHIKLHERREQLKFAIYSKILFYTLVTISGIAHTKRCGNII
jgi:hypothetical protein